MASYSSGSHEVFVGIRFCRKKEEVQEELKMVEAPSESIDSTEVDEEATTQIAPAMDTVFVTKIDTVYITAPVQEVITVEEKKAFVPIEKDILFEFDKAVVQKESFGELESIVNILNAKDDLKVSLRGHTDASGPDAYNETLSKNRVSAVEDFLKSNGIDADRILIEALGEKSPIADNTSKKGRKLNRRVEVRFIEQ